MWSKLLSSAIRGQDGSGRQGVRDPRGTLTKWARQTDLDSSNAGDRKIVVEYQRDGLQCQDRNSSVFVVRGLDLSG